MTAASKNVLYKIPHEDNIWFSPAKVLRDHASLSDEKRVFYTTDERKVITEAFQTSIMLLGIMEATRQEYWLQLVSPREQAPDIRTMCMEPRSGKSDSMHVQDVEVTEYEDHSMESLFTFLKRTKLSPKKSYPLDTIILCFINKDTLRQDWSEVHRDLSEIESPLNVYIVGRTSLKEQEYSLIHINPELELPVRYHALKGAEKWCRIHTRKVKRGTKKESIKRPDERHFPFWQEG